METITFDTYISWDATRREKGLPEPRIIFSVPVHTDLRPHLSKADQAFISCYYRNLKFKYSTLKKGTAIRLTAEIETGPRGGETLHIKELEVLSPSQPRSPAASRPYRPPSCAAGKRKS